jgi:hypothetical protein
VLLPPPLFILIGTPFYLLGILEVYAYIQILAFLIAYIWLLRHLKPFSIKINFKRRDLILYTIFFAGIGYLLSFESFNNVTYAFEDTVTTNLWNIDIFEGYSGYYPGFAIYLSPIYLWINPVESLDFLGFVIGFIFLLYTSVALEISKKYLGLIFLSLFSLAVFNQSQLSLISFSPNKFSVLYIGLLVVLLREILISQKNLKISIFLLCSLLVSLPLANLPLLPYFLVILTMSLIWGWSPIKQILRNPQLAILFALVIVINASIILYLYMGKSSARSWLIFNNLSLTTSSSDVASKIWLSLLKHSVEVKFIIDPFNSITSFGGGLSIIFAMVVTLYSARKRHMMYGIIDSSVTLLGLSTYTGILQISMIKGRVGWYFSILMIILTSSLLLELDTKEKTTSFILILCTLIFIGNLRTPPEFFRSYPEEVHRIIFSLGKDLKSNFYLYSQIKGSDIHSVLNPKVVTIDNSMDLLKKVNRAPGTLFLVVLDLRQEVQIQNPALLEKISVSKTYIKDKSTRENNLVYVIALKNTLLQKGFTTYFADNEYEKLIRPVT